MLTAKNFTYAFPDDAPWRRGLVRCIEHLTGKPKLWRLYKAYSEDSAAADFFYEAVSRLELEVQANVSGLDALPTRGPLIIVANHPYGVIDGLVLGYLVSRRRADFRILVHSALYKVPEARPYLLPIDFAETREATRTNLESRRAALKDLAADRCIVIYPSGGIATAANPLRGEATDLEWKTFIARMVHQSRAPVVPVYFEGQCSRLFQVASHVSMDLRASLFFREAVKQIGGVMRAHIGQPIPYESLAPIADRKALTEHLREATYALRPPKERRDGPGQAAPAGRESSLLDSSWTETIYEPAARALPDWDGVVPGPLYPR